MAQIDGVNPVLCAVVYQPTKSNKDLIQECTEFLEEIMPKYDRPLIVGDFNNHVCCPFNSLAKDF